MYRYGYRLLIMRIYCTYTVYWEYSQYHFISFAQIAKKYNRYEFCQDKICGSQPELLARRLEAEPFVLALLFVLALCEEQRENMITKRGQDVQSLVDVSHHLRSGGAGSRSGHQASLLPSAQMVDPQQRKPSSLTTFSPLTNWKLLGGSGAHVAGPQVWN